jgi:hypothetical protein
MPKQPNQNPQKPSPERQPDKTPLRREVPNPDRGYARPSKPTKPKGIQR